NFPQRRARNFSSTRNGFWRMATAGNGRSQRTSNSTRPTAEGWLGMLGVLTDGELAQYASLARDQARREERLGWVKGAFAVASVAILVWSIGRLVRLDFDKVLLVPLGISVLLGYWPYRAVRSRRLWQSHMTAVRNEQMRRSGQGRRQEDTRR